MWVPWGAWGRRDPNGPRVPRLASFAGGFCFSLQLIPRECFPRHPRCICSRVGPGSVIFPWDRLGWELVERFQLPRRVTAEAAGPAPRGSRGQPQGSAAGRPPPAPGSGTPGEHTPPWAGPRCRGRVTRGGRGAALASRDPSPPLSTCCSRASRVAAGSLSAESRKTPNPSVRFAPNSLRARHVSRSSPASRPKITINPPGAEGHLTCQSPILARIDILAAGSESPGPCWSWTARASHSPGTPVGKSSPYLSRDSLTWP